MTKKVKQSIVALICMIAMIGLDQWTKALAIAKLKEKEPFVIIKDTFVFRYLENQGAAFSSMEGKTVWLLVSTAVLMGILIWLYLITPETTKWRVLRITLVSIVAGGIGNFIDRVRFHYVVDFIYFQLINFPTFNVADCYVTIAVFALFFEFIFLYKDEDWEEVKVKFPKFLQGKDKKQKDRNEKE